MTFDPMDAKDPFPWLAKGDLASRGAALDSLLKHKDAGGDARVTDKEFKRLMTARKQGRV